MLWKQRSVWFIYQFCCSGGWAKFWWKGKLQRSNDIYFIIILIVIVFFHYHLVPLDTLPPAIATLLSMTISPLFLFAPSFHLLTSSSPLAVILLSIYESVPIFLVSSLCSLDSTYEWNHVFLSLAYFTSHHVLQVHPILLQRVKSVYP